MQQARDLELSIEEGKGLRVLSQALLANGQREPALAAFEQSLSLLAERYPYQAARTKMDWGRYLVVSGMNADRGMTLLQEARATFRQLGAQRDLAAVEETLQYPNGGK